MAFTEALRLIIDADTGGAVRGIQKVGDTTTKELTRSQKSLDKWSRGLTTAGAGMVAFGAAALFGLGKAALASEEAELGFRKLQNSIANNPKLSADAAEGFRKQAAAIQDVTAADADAIVAGQAVLAQRKLNAKQIEQLTPLIVDLARKKGIDEVAAFTLAAKAVDGNSGALKRAGISIDEAAFKSDAFGATVDALRTSVGGFAEAEGKTFAGSLERMKNELGDVVEGVGSGAVDAFSTLFGVVDAGSDKLNEISPAAQNAIGKFATFGSVALIAAGGLSFTIGQIIKMRQNFELASGAIANFAGSGGLGRLAKVSLVVGGFIALREVLMALEDDLEGIDVSTLENELAKLAETGKLGGEQLSSIFEGLNAAIESGDPQKIEAMSNQLGEVDKALAQLAGRDPQAAASAFRLIQEALVDIGASSGQIKTFFNDYLSAVAETDTASRTGAGGVDELGGAMGDAADETSDAQAALQEYLDTLSGLFDPLFSATDALMDNQQAQVAVTAAEMELAAAIQEHGANSLEAASAQQKLTEAQITAGKSALDVKQATAELSAAVRDGTVNVADAKDMLNSWVAQGLISKSTAATLAAQFDTTAAAANKLGDTDPNVRVSESGGSATRGTLNKVQTAAINAGRQRPNVRVSATDRASGILRTVQGLIFSLPSSKTFTFNARVTGMQELNRARALTGRQHGGPVLAREAYVVGEAGPEVLLMGEQGGTIVPHGVSVPGGMGGGGGGAVDVRLHITGSGRLAQDFNHALRTGEIQLSANGQRVKVG